MDWGQEEKGTTEDEMAGWHHQLDAHGFGWTPGVGDGQGGLACCSSWSHKESDTTEQLNWTELNWFLKENSDFLCSTSLLAPPSKETWFPMWNVRHQLGTRTHGFPGSQVKVSTTSLCCFFGTSFINATEGGNETDLACSGDWFSIVVR